MDNRQSSNIYFAPRLRTNKLRIPQHCCRPHFNFTPQFALCVSFIINNPPHESLSLKKGITSCSSSKNAYTTYSGVRLVINSILGQKNHDRPLRKKRARKIDNRFGCFFIWIKSDSRLPYFSQLRFLTRLMGVALRERTTLCYQRLSRHKILYLFSFGAILENHSLSLGHL